jgi:hypothetical protein
MRPDDGDGEEGTYTYLPGAMGLGYCFKPVILSQILYKIKLLFFFSSYPKPSKQYDKVIDLH